MGENGADVKLSEAAQAVFPFSIECKNQEHLNIWAALEQAEGHSEADGNTPAVVFTRNRAKTYIAMEFEDFLELWAGK